METTKTKKETYTDRLHDEITMALQPLEMHLQRVIDQSDGDIKDGAYVVAEIGVFLLEATEKLLLQKVAEIEGKIGEINLIREKRGGSLYDGGKLVSVTLGGLEKAA